MSRVRQTKTTFTSGEVSRRLMGRGDLRAYENGALTLENLFIDPTGGVSRRAGLYYVDTAAGAGRLIDFEFNTQQTYLIAITDALLTIYQDGAAVAVKDAPWSEAQTAQLTWTQSADTLLICHPDVEPQKLYRTSGGGWVLEAWSYFAEDNGTIRRPMFNFTDHEITLTPSGTSGSVTLSASADVFTADYVGSQIRIRGIAADVAGYIDPTNITVTLLEDLITTDATVDWQEAAFSVTRGWPASVAFHQDRLVIGGSRDLPNRLWLSKSGDIWNFDLGEGLDDEAIDFAILSDQVNAIRAVFSGRHLQVFTSGAEWRVSGDPLTPTSIQVNRQTRVGSLVDRQVPPIDVDGATLYAARSGRELREFLYTDIEAAYQSNDLSLVARHIIKDPVDQVFDKEKRLIHLVLQDGTLATLTMYRSEQVMAWTRQNTDGEFLSVANVGGEIYCLIRRGGSVTIEALDDEVYLDSALMGEAANPATLWSGLSHLEGKAVSIVADGRVHPEQVVTDGSITLDDPASVVSIGLPYTHIVEPLPPSTVETGGAGRAARLVEGIFRLEETSAFTLDVGRGLQDVPLRDFDEAVILDAAPPVVSRDISIRAYGWVQDMTQSLWRVEQTAPLPFTLLSVTTEMKIND